MQVMVKEHHCNPHMKDKRGITPSFLATMNDHSKVVQLISPSSKQEENNNNDDDEVSKLCSNYLNRRPFRFTL